MKQEEIFNILLSITPHVNMRYLKRYIKFVFERFNRSIVESQQYTERHHIIPKCMNGSDTKDNIIILTYREHFLVHLILAKTFPKHPIVQTINRYECINSRIFELKKKLASDNYKGTIVVASVKEPDNFRRINLETYLTNKNEYIHPSTGRVLCKTENGKTYSVPITEFNSGNHIAISAGMINVKDASGNILQVSTSDPRYTSGELKSICVNKISAKDHNGNTLSIDANDERYKSKELVGVCAGTATVKHIKCIKNKSFRCNINDINFIFGFYVGSTIGHSIYKDKDGNKVYCNRDEAKTNNLSGITSGMAVMKTPDGTIRYVSVEDIKDSDLVGITKGSAIGYDKDGNKVFTTTADPRFKTGELTGNRKNTITVFKDGTYITIHKSKLEEYLGLGYIKKGVPKPRKK